ncbi:MAG: hypothetical protein WAT79_10795 [Saprospiraceae bacterium]
MHRDEHSQTNWENQISLFLDNQLSTDEKNNFVQSIKNNPDILQWVETEKKFREIVKLNFQRPIVSEGFAEMLKEKIEVL